MIRLATISDLPLLAAVEVSAAQRFIGTPMAFVATASPSPPDALASAMAANCLWVAADTNDAPVGFLFGELVANWFHVLELSVAAAAQGCGHGRALLASAMAAASGFGCDWMSLTTDREISFNGPWYARQGFGEIAPDKAPDWLAAILAREAASGLDMARRTIMTRRL